MDFLDNNIVETTLVDIPALLHVARLDDMESGQSWLSVERSLGLDPKDELLQPYRDIIATGALFSEEVAAGSMLAGRAELAMYAFA